VAKNYAFRFRRGHACSFGLCARPKRRLFDAVGPARMEVTGRQCSARCRHSARRRDGHWPRLSTFVRWNHFPRECAVQIRGNENDAPTFFKPTEDVAEIERRTPMKHFTSKRRTNQFFFRVRNLEERFRFEDSQVVHQNVGLWEVLLRTIDTRESAKVAPTGQFSTCSGETLGNLFIAEFTRASLRPLMTTVRHRQLTQRRWQAMPAVEPDTIAVFALR